MNMYVDQAQPLIKKCTLILNSVDIDTHDNHRLLLYLASITKLLMEAPSETRYVTLVELSSDAFILTSQTWLS
jgi:hypothetical protein